MSMEFEMKKKGVLGACAMAMAVSMAIPAFAAPDAEQEGPWLVRLRALHMNVDNDTSRGVDLELDDKTFPEIDFSYFFTPNLAAELILTYPQKHDVDLNGAGIGSIKHLPPTLLLQYHFMPQNKFKPYVGAGLNYTRLTSVDVPSGVSVDRNSFGLAVQAGFDYKLTRHWYLNVDVKYIDIDTEVKAGGAKLTTLQVDPVLYSVGIGYRF